MCHLALREITRRASQEGDSANTLATPLERDDDRGARTLVLARPPGLTPLSFPLWAEGQRGQLSTEDWRTRVRRAAEQLERRHGG